MNTERVIGLAAGLIIVLILLFILLKVAGM
jgi:tetrahydromethanopterin S-methyltransferase subunit F